MQFLKSQILCCRNDSIRPNSGKF